MAKNIRRAAPPRWLGETRCIRCGAPARYLLTISNGIDGSPSCDSHLLQIADDITLAKLKNDIRAGLGSKWFIKKYKKEKK